MHEAIVMFDGNCSTLLSALFGVTCRRCVAGMAFATARVRVSAVTVRSIRSGAGLAAIEERRLAMGSRSSSAESQLPDVIVGKSLGTDTALSSAEISPARQ
jgi:hypothetical protein